MLTIEKSLHIDGARGTVGRLKRLVEASEDLDDWQDYNWLMGEVLLAEEEYRGAVANLMHAPVENPRVMYQLAVALRERGAHDKAREAFNRVKRWNRPGLLYAMTRPAAEAALLTQAQVR